jgi:hypothetical protein
MGNHLGLLHRDERMARKGRHDGRPQLDALRPYRRCGKGRQVIRACHSRRHPGRRNTQLFGTFDHGQRVLYFIARYCHTD